MLRILIVDDEEAAGVILTVLLQKHISGPLEIKCCTDPSVALAMLESYQPTLLMLDIEMPGMNGFDFLSKATAWNFDVIFTTAFDKYAIKAIRFSALDYLLKPIDITDLKNAVNRHIIKKEHEFEEQKKLVDNLMHNLHQKDQSEFKLAISVKEGVFFYELKNIICLEGYSNYTKFFFNHQKPLMVSKTIKEYEEILAEHHFLRVHKSYLVNKAHVIKVDKEGMLCMSNQMQVSVSRRRKSEMLQLFSKG